jgi:hypothetical protein
VNYETFSVLPLHLDVKARQTVDVFVVMLDWRLGFLKIKKSFDNNTMLQVFKLEIAEELKLNSLRLIGTISGSDYTNKVKSISYQ